MEKQESRIALRLPLKQRQQIDKLIQEDKIKNISELIRQAIKQFLENPQ